MKEIIKSIICFIIIVILTTAFVLILMNDIKEKEYIKQLEQSLHEQIQETEVYRSMLETYQTEGIINE